MLMDEDSRPVLEALLKGDLVGSALDPEWHSWLASQDVALVAMRPAFHQIWPNEVLDKDSNNEWQEAFEHELPGEDELFGDPPTQDSASDDGAPWNAIVAKVRQMIDDYPFVARLGVHVDLAAVGLQLDDENRALVEARIRWREGSPLAGGSLPAQDSPPELTKLDDGPFVLFGGGPVPDAYVTPLAEMYTRYSLSSLAELGDDEYRQQDVEQLTNAVVRLLQHVESISVVSRPPEGPEGVFSNGFLFFHASDAKQIYADVSDIVKHWNWLMDHAEGDVCLQFDSQPTQIAGLNATEYSADMAAAVGGQQVDGLEQIMEKLFGSGGKYLIQLVMVDSSTILLANATRSQTERIVAELSSEKPRLLDAAHVQAAKSILSQQPGWEVYFHPEAYTKKLSKQKDAELGEVVGGPVVDLFPAGPAIGCQLQWQPDAIHIELAAPAETLRGLGQYLGERR
jgi:hypothetical protein